MRILTVLLGGAALIAAPVLAQTAAPAASDTPAAGRTPTTSGAPTSATPTTAPSMSAGTTASTSPASASATATSTTVTPGAQVIDTKGGAVGTIDSVANGVAVLSTGTNKVSIPVASFARGPNGLVLGMTKAQVDATASQSAAAAGPVEITAGAEVLGQSGAKIGTVKAVSGDLVTVASTTAQAQIPKASFAKTPAGLAIGMTPAQFDAAAKAAGGAKPATPKN